MSAIQRFLDLAETTFLIDDDSPPLYKIHVGAWKCESASAAERLRMKNFVEVGNGFFALEFHMHDSAEGANEVNRRLVMRLVPNTLVSSLHRVWEGVATPHPHRKAQRFFPPDHRFAVSKRFGNDAFTFPGEGSRMVKHAR